MDFEVKNQKKREKNNSKNVMFFSIVFFYWFWEGLGRILGWFWKGFGGSWRLLGHFLASFFGACIQNALQKGSWRLLGSILVPFWRFWEGFGERFGNVLGKLGMCRIRLHKIGWNSCYCRIVCPALSGPALARLCRERFFVNVYACSQNSCSAIWVCTSWMSSSTCVDTGRIAVDICTVPSVSTYAY